jgi:hypothetical protein
MDAARDDDQSDQDGKSPIVGDLGGPTIAAPDVPETPDATIARLKSEIATLTLQLLTLQLAARADLLKDHTDRGPMPEWLNVKTAAYRYGCCNERMRQLAESGTVVSRQDYKSGPISIFTASLDERLRLLGRKPRR